MSSNSSTSCQGNSDAAGFLKSLVSEKGSKLDAAGFSKSLVFREGELGAQWGGWQSKCEVAEGRHR